MKSIRYPAAAVLVLLAAGCGDPNPVAPRAGVPAPVRNASDGGSAMGSGNVTDADTLGRGGMTMGSGNAHDPGGEGGENTNGSHDGGLLNLTEGHQAQELPDSIGITRGGNTMGSGN